MFIIRVELHHTTNYEPLHSAMAKRGMSRTIPCNGQPHVLPNATYYFAGSSTAANVATAVDAAAAEAGHRNAMIVVADASSIQINNLPVASAYRYGA